MVYYPCPKCNAIFNKKSNFISHINRIYDCSKKVNNEDNLNELAEISTNLHELAEISTNIEKSNKNEIFSMETDNCSKETNDFSNINETSFNCSYCNKKLSSKYILMRHLKDYCKVKKANDEVKENTFKMLLERDKLRENEINELKKQNKLFEEQNKILMDKIDKLINMKTDTKSSKTINNNKKITNNTQNNQKITNNTQNNTQNTNNTSNTQNNFVMVNFGKEDLKMIDEREFIDRIVKQNKISGVKIPDEVLKIIHFNPKYPQLSNIYISDINREKCMVYEDGEWKLSNIDNIPQVMDKICLFSKDQIEILREKHPNNKALLDRLNTIEKYNNKIDEDYIQDLREDEDYNGVKIIIKDAEDFQKYAYNTLKKTLYNEGKKLKKNIKVK